MISFFPPASESSLSVWNVLPHQNLECSQHPLQREHGLVTKICHSDVFMPEFGTRTSDAKEEPPRIKCDEAGTRGIGESSFQNQQQLGICSTHYTVRTQERLWGGVLTEPVLQNHFYCFA